MSVYSGLVQLLQVSLSVSCVLWPLFYLCCCCCYYLTATINNETFWNCDWMNGFNISSSALKEWSPEEGWTRSQVRLHMYICGDPFNECTQVLHSGQFGCTFEQDKGQWWWWWWLTFHFLLFNSQLFIVYILLQCLCCHHHNNISTLFINYQNPSRQVSGPSQVHHTKERYNIIGPSLPLCLSLCTNITRNTTIPASVLLQQQKTTNYASEPPAQP